MFINKSDIIKNRLYVTFKGRMEVAEIKAGGANVLEEAKKLRPKFGIISDITEFIPTSEEGRLAMQNTMKSLKEMGLGHVVRIIKKNITIPASQWQRTSRTVGYDAHEVSTLKEAEALLDKLEKQ